MLFIMLYGNPLSNNNMLQNYKSLKHSQSTNIFMVFFEFLQPFFFLKTVNRPTTGPEGSEVTNRWLS